MTISLYLKALHRIKAKENYIQPNKYDIKAINIEY